MSKRPKNDKTIYELGLHETISTKHYFVTRVAGGWIYARVRANDTRPTVFVPYNNEFQPAPEPFSLKEYDPDEYLFTPERELY